METPRSVIGLAGQRSNASYQTQYEMATASELITQVLRRLDELAPSVPVRWTRAELVVFLNDAIHELNLVTALLQDSSPLAVTTTDNVYDLPSKTIAPLSISLGSHYLLRYSVAALDDEADWELAGAVRLRVESWAPLGLSKVIIFPRPVSAQNLSVERVMEHTALTDAATALPVSSEYEPALEDFVVSRALFKEGGAEFQAGVEFYKRFLLTVRELAGRVLTMNYPVLDAARTVTSRTTLRERAPRPVVR